MQEESKQEDGGAQGTAEKGSSWSKAARVFTDNPTIVVTVLYAYATGVGMIYSAALYGRFGINVFDYAEIGDFLLAAFKNPVAFLSAGLLAGMGSAVLSYRAFATRRRLREVQSHKQQLEEKEQAHDEAMQKAHEEAMRDKESGEDEVREWLREWQADIRTREMEQKHFEEVWMGRERRRTVAIAITIAITIVFSTALLPYYSAGKRASSIKHGEQPAVDVWYRSFSGSVGQVTEPNLTLAGATQKAVFFYGVDEKHTIVIPQAQIVSIEVPEQD